MPDHNWDTAHKHGCSIVERQIQKKKKKKNHIHERAFPTVYKNSY